ncbi:MAG TPA: hypothetical protein VED63_01030 [Acidimicrobiales bacterium]|nr:hypothetical protein [Acidimicrobiales bacterium]
MMRPAHRERRWARIVALAGRRLRHHRGDAGQSMAIILGVLLTLSLGTALMVQSSFEEFPLVSGDVLQHASYRAMVAGLDEYLYAVNANPDFVACSAKFYTNAGVLVGTSPLNGSSPICGALSFGTWISIPGEASANGPPSWFLLSTPSINTSNGYLSFDVVGVAGFAPRYYYQSAVVTLDPTNSFLLNVSWVNYNQVDPAVVAQYNGVAAPTCTYYWPSDTLGHNCENIEYAATDALTGNVFANDSIWVCDSPTFQSVKTADTQQKYVQNCSGTPTSTSWTNGVAVEPIPTDNTTLNTDAKYNGCLYEGPTTFLFDGASMGVYSPNTPTGPPSGAPGTSVSNDALNDPSNTGNVCMPKTAASTTLGTAAGDALTSGHAYTSLTVKALGSAVAAGDYLEIGSGATTQIVTASAAAAVNATSISVNSFTANANYANSTTPVTDLMVAMPTAGVVFAENCPVTTVCNSTAYNPLSAAGETGVGGATVGDAIVQGQVSGPVTVGAENNIVVDGNLCYSDDVSGSPSNCTSAPSTTPASVDVLGLVALNYVEINHPLSGGADAATCPAGLGNGNPTCDLSNPIVDAVILALNHSFIVDNYSSGASLGTLTINGTIDQDWRGPVATVNGSGTVVTGYSKNYVYDSRMEYLAPPYYLNPGTSQWAIASFTVVAGACKQPTGQTCPAGYP